MFKKIWLALVISVFGAVSASASDGYEVTAQQGDKKITYTVYFGGGQKFDQYTAFDPKSKTFVYLTWDRTAKPPKPVKTVWDKDKGEKIPLYKFPNVKEPLPIIPSIEAMKVCPITGDKNFKAKLAVIVD
jgi:hypothetical protein